MNLLKPEFEHLVDRYDTANEIDHLGLKIIGVLRQEGKKIQQIVFCPKCAKDSELYLKGVFLIGKTDFIKKCTLPCGCSSSPNWNPDQLEVLVKRRCRELNYRFVSLKGQKINSSAKVVFECLKHNTVTDTVKISPFINKTVDGCAECVVDTRSANKFIPTEEYDIILKNRKILNRKDKLVSRTKNTFTFECDNCKDDIYYKELGNIFTITREGMFLTGKNCRCGKHMKSTREREIFIEHIISEENLPYTEVSINNPEDIYENLKIGFICSEHGIQEKSYSNFVYSGSRCTGCAVNGFNPDKPARIYCTIWSYGNSVFCKVGITNRSTSERLKEQTRNTNYNIINTLEWFSEDGHLIKSIEKEVEDTFISSVIPKHLFPDGFTETYSITNYKEIVGLIKTRMDN